MKPRVDLTHQLKALQTQQAQLTEELEKLNVQKSDIDTRRNRISQELLSVAAQIKRLKDSAKDPIVSEHALLRYVERIMGVDLEKIRREILDEKTVEALKFGASRYHKDNYTLIVREGTVVTVELT